MTTVAIIPARMGSTRFPGKPLALIHNIPMIGHVYFRTKQCALLDDVYIATCDDEIRDYAFSIGAKCIMTSAAHERCSDRTAEAMLKIEEGTGQRIETVVMVQGDEPMIDAAMISAALHALQSDTSINVVNLMSRIDGIEEFEDPNEVKVVVDAENNAIYFSREPIPSRKKGVLNVPMYKQVCVIPFRRDYLLKFNSMPQTELEKIESVDMLRVIENGDKVKMAKVESYTCSVDTPSDLECVMNLMSPQTVY
jgi:3-deoxy-manno-octulosonate cytidylyltransferase (CMP-KDO synthetase)